MKTSYASVVEFTGAEVTAGLANNLPASVWVLNTTTNALSQGNPSGAPGAGGSSNFPKVQITAAGDALTFAEHSGRTVHVETGGSLAAMLPVHWDIEGVFYIQNHTGADLLFTVGAGFTLVELGNQDVAAGFTIPDKVEALVKVNTDGFVQIGISSQMVTQAELDTKPSLASSTPANLGVAAAVGTGTTAARADHIHPRPTASEVGAATLTSNAPANLAAAAAVGTGTAAARDDHAHLRPTLGELGAQATLVSGTNIKTVDGQSLVGAGNLAPTILLITAPIAIRITGAAGAGTNYQTKLTIGESGGSTGANFNLSAAAGTFPAGKNATCSFLFWDSTGSVPFWVEKVTGTTPNRVAHVWVLPNVDLSSGTQTVFLTTAATNLVRSNGDVVFTFFDDFDGAAVDTAKWDTAVLSGQTLASSVLSFGGGNVARRLLTLNTLGDGVEIMSLLRASDTNASTSNFGFVETNAITSTFSYRNVWDSASAVLVGTTPTTLTNNINNGAGVLQVMRIGRAGGAGRFTSENPVNTFTAASGVPTTATRSTIYNTYDNSTEIDWVAVKKFVAAEPAFLSAVM